MCRRGSIFDCETELVHCLEDMYGINTPIAEDIRDIQSERQTAKVRIEALNMGERIDRLEQYIVSDFHEQTTQQSELADGTVPFDGEARRLDD